MTDFFTRIGDRINPIVVKETRQAVNSRFVAGFLLLFLVIQLVAMLLMVAAREFSTDTEVDMRAGRQMFTFVQGILLGACLVLIPAMAGMRLVAERNDVNVDLLFISSLTPRAVLAGKLFASAALALLIFSACAPFMVFAYVMRGLDVQTIFVVLLADYLAVLAATMMSLFLASIPANRGARVLLGTGGFIFMGYLGLGLLALSAEFLEFRSDVEMADWKFWVACGGLTALVLGVIGLLFVWSVALISPHASNRALQVRVYTLGFWIATAIGFCVWSWIEGRPEPIYFWGLIGCALFSLQFVIGVCERDEWGARAASRIPHNPILRLPAMLFYSGAAGSIAFGVIGAVLTTVTVLVWGLFVVPTTHSRDHFEVTLILGGIAAYTYCYSLTGALFRRLLAYAGFPGGFTWLLVALIFVLSCLVPFFISFALFDRYARVSHPYEVDLIYLPNAVVTIQTASHDQSAQIITPAVIFLILWGGLVTALNIPWFAKQIMRFRPPKSKAEAETEAKLKAIAEAQSEAEAGV